MEWFDGMQQILNAVRRIASTDGLTTQQCVQMLLQHVYPILFPRTPPEGQPARKELHMKKR